MRSLENAIINAVETRQIIGYKTVTILPTGKVLKVDTGVQGVILSDSGKSSNRVSPQKEELAKGNTEFLSINRKFSAIFRDFPFIINQGGRGSGKTMSATLATILETYKEQTRNVMVLRFNKSSVKDSIYSEIVKMLEKLDLTEDFTIGSNDIQNNITGSKILFKGIKTSSLDVRDTLKGITDLSSIIIEEAADLDKDFDEVLELLKGTMRTKGFFYRILIILNPRSKSHSIYKRYLAGLENESEHTGEHKDAYIISSTFKDNAALPMQYIEGTILKAKEFSPEVYEHVYEGKWKDIGEGQIIKRYSTGAYQEHTPTILGIDLGFRDETAGLMVSIDRKTMRCYVKLVLFGSNYTSDDLVAALVPYSEYTMILDSARPEIIADFNRKGFIAKGATKGAGSVLDGITRMTSFEMVVDPQNSDKVFEAFSNYSWKGTAQELPDHAFSHIPDAIRYAVMHLTGKATGRYFLDVGGDQFETDYNYSNDRYCLD
jgi:phage terminase large subunit